MSPNHLHFLSTGVAAGAIRVSIFVVDARDAHHAEIFVRENVAVHHNGAGEGLGDCVPVGGEGRVEERRDDVVVEKRCSAHHTSSASRR